jgi:hypothetical protein
MVERQRPRRTHFDGELGGVIALVSLIPVGLGLFLLAFGVPERRLLAPKPLNVAFVGAVAVLVGPVAMITLGVAGWLTLMALLVAGVLLAAGLEPPRRGPAAEQR